MALTSPLGNLFVVVQDRLKVKVSALKWIDQNFGQLNNYEPGYKPPVLFPCALIDVTGFTFEDLSNGEQLATGRVVISIGTTPYSRSDANTPISFKEQALAYYDIENYISNALHNWKPAGFNKLLRRALDKQDRDDSIRERILVFECSFIDTSAASITSKIPRPNPVVGTDTI